MDPQVSEALEMVRELLKQMKTSKVAESEAKMRELVKNTHILTTIYSILTNEQQQYWVRTMAATFLNSYFTEVLCKENLEGIEQSLGYILCNDQVSNVHKKLFSKSIIRCLQVAAETQAHKWLLFIQQFLKKESTYEVAFLVIACIADAGTYTSILQSLITQIYEKTLNIIEVNDENAFQLSQLIKSWMAIIQNLAEQRTMGQLLQKMIGSPSLTRLVVQIYQLQATENTIICMEGDPKDLNILKCQASQLHKTMLGIQIKNQGPSFSSVLELTLSYTRKFANTLTLMFDFREQFQNFGCEDLLTNLLSITILYLSIKPEQFDLDYAIKLQNKIIFPFLKIDDNQMNDFQQSPERFNALAEDCCDKQALGTLKTQAAKLLQYLGDKVEGSMKYAIIRATQSINLKFGYEQTYSFSDTEFEILELQTAFQVLSIFSYELCNYPDQISGIAKRLQDKRAQSLPPLQMARIFTFLAYNFFQVFKNPVDGQDWVDLAINYNVHPSTRFCALDCFSNITEEYFNELYLQKIGEEIQNGKAGIIWQIVRKLIQKYYDKIPTDGILMLISRLFLRLHRQFNSLVNKEKTDSLNILNCLRAFSHMLRRVKKQESSNLQRKQAIVYAIEPILDFYSEAKKLDIQDDVVKIAIEIINSADQLRSDIYKLLPEYITTFVSSKISYSLKVYFRFFNQLLAKTKFSTNKEEVLKIMQVLKDGFQYIVSKLYDPKQNRLKYIPYYRLALCYTLLVIQNALVYFGTHFVEVGNTQYFQEISTLCIKLLPQSETDPIQKTPSGHIILARALNTLFVCHMHLRVESIFHYLVLLQDQRLYHGYDTKVLVKCVAKQVFEQPEADKILFLIAVLGKFVQKSEAKDESLAKNKSKGRNSAKMSQQLKKIDDYDKLIDQIDSPFKTDKDIRMMLTQMFAGMKTGNKEAFYTMLQALPAEVFNYYSSIIDFQNLQKKKRVYIKVAGLKMGDAMEEIKGQHQVDHEESWQVSQASYQEQQPNNLLKRERTKSKMELKLRKKRKLSTELQNIHEEVEEEG